MSIVLIAIGWGIATVCSMWAKSSKEPSNAEMLCVGTAFIFGIGMMVGGMMRFLFVNHVFDWISEHVKF